MVGGRERWGRVMFFVCAFALLATSKPRGWSMAAAVVGPTTPATGLALRVEIDATAEPRLRATGIAKAYLGIDAPCLSRWASGSSVTCFLPPGAGLTSVEIRGDCGGCENGCPPPPGSYVKAVATEVSTWTDTASGSLGATLPSHGPKMIASLFEVRVSGAAFVRVAGTITPHAGGAPLVSEEQSCEPDPAAAPGVGGAVAALCRFLIFDSDVGPPRAIDFAAEATGWGPCVAGAAGAAPTPTCAPPKTLRIDSVRLAP